MTLPESIERCVTEQFLADRRRAYVLTDKEGILVERGGDLEWFELQGLELGTALVEHLSMFQGFVPNPDQPPECLPRIEMAEGRSTDVYLGPTSEGAYVVFLDATAEAEREQRFQQRGNEFSLMLRALGLMVFERLADDRFVALVPATTWLRALRGKLRGPVDLSELFPFLETFLDDAEATWEGRGARTSWSGMWIERAEGTEWSLEASATRLEDGRRLLVIQSLDRRYEERLKILQQARTRTLDFERLQKEIGKKEILLHCIVHDLNGPLSAMVGCMSLVQQSELDAERIREVLALGLEQARSQESMIRTVLETFASEMKSLQTFESEAEHAPDLLSCLRHALETFQSAYSRRQITLDLAVDPDVPGVFKVVGASLRLERVICNLLENALRYSPDRAVVRVRVGRQGDGTLVSVEDQGPGVESEVIDHLFQRFGGSSRSGGIAGLGLYYCRSTLELWGGRIGYEPRAEGGSRFWFTLRAAL